jgi:hypothetical protein
VKIISDTTQGIPDHVTVALFALAPSVLGLSRSEFENVSIELLKALFPMQKAVRLLGVSISGFKFDEIRGNEQIALFTPGSEPGGCRMSMVFWLGPAWIQAYCGHDNTFIDT